jgi:hypothetical protein
VSFYTATQCEILYTLPAAVTKNTYTTQAIFSAPTATAPVASIPAGYFMNPPSSGIGKALYLRALGTIATTSAATLAVAIGIDPTPGTIANAVSVMAATAPVAAITAEFDLEAWITARAIGQTGGMTLQLDGHWVMEGSTSAGGAGVATALRAGFTASVTGLQGSLSYALELLGTWSASAAGNTTTLNQMFLFGLN